MWHPVESAWATLAGQLGLSRIALHHTTFEPEPRCGCADGFDCTAIGKHPKYKGYPDSGTTGEHEARMLVIADWRNGFGVLTGTASGVVVIGLAAATPAMADALVDLALNGSSEAVRVKALAEAMDRAGVRGGVEVDVVVGQSEVSVADLLRDRLALLRRRTLEAAAADQAAVEAVSDPE